MIGRARLGIFGGNAAEFAPTPLADELDILHAHEDKDDDGKGDGLFEEHLVKLSQIAPVRIVIEEDLHGL